MYIMATTYYVWSAILIILHLTVRVVWSTVERWNMFPQTPAQAHSVRATTAGTSHFFYPLRFKIKHKPHSNAVNTLKSNIYQKLWPTISLLFPFICPHVDKQVVTGKCFTTVKQNAVGTQCCKAVWLLSYSHHAVGFNFCWLSLWSR